MATDALLIKRFAELEAKMNALRVAAGVPYPPYYEPEDWQQWATSAQHLIRSSFGEASPHYQNFSAAYARCSNGLKFRVDELKGVFRAAKEDYDGGYAFSIHAMISGEIFSDFVKLSKNALEEGAKDVAAVLACASLEDALKRFALLNGLDVSDKTMQDVVNALKAKGLVGGAQKTLLDTMPKIRDYAMHANWDKITSQDVGSVLGFVEQFLLAKFS